MADDLSRRDIEDTKRIFLDRLATDVQGLFQPADIDLGPGDEYVYGGTYDPANFGVGADCSGAVGTFVECAFNGGPDMVWGRKFSTETFPGPYKGFRQVSRDELLHSNSPIKVCIQHGGGGPNSHMNCAVDGVVMESNGDHGTCTLNHGAIPQDSDFWNDWWVYDGGITEDTDWRQPLGYPRGLDYAGGRPNVDHLRGANIAFVCRYLTSGGSGLPGKQLLPDEFAALQAAGIQVVFNYETTADFMLGGHDAGRSNARDALDYINSLPGIGDTAPVVYFSCDFDEAESQQDAINGYLNGAAEILGGPDNVGIYGAYWVGMRALNAGACKYLWQTEAWSGQNIDSRVNILQRNHIGYQYVDGVQCDINESRSADFGQWPRNVAAAPITPPIIPQPAPAPLPSDVMLKAIFDQVCGTWPQLGGDPEAIKTLEAKVASGQALTLVDRVAWLGHHASIHKNPT